MLKALDVRHEVVLFALMQLPFRLLDCSVNIQSLHTRLPLRSMQVTFTVYPQVLLYQMHQAYHRVSILSPSILRLR